MFLFTSPVLHRDSLHNNNIIYYSLVRAALFLFCSELVSAANFPPSSPVVFFFSLSRFWPRCRLWHHFVQISPIPPFHKSKRSRLLCWCSYRQTGRRATFENVSVLWPSLTAALIAEGTMRCLLKMACAMFWEQHRLCNVSSLVVCDKEKSRLDDVFGWKM